MLQMCTVRMSTKYYRYNVLRRHVVLLFRCQELHTFQHDNARAHTMRASVDFFNQNNVAVLKWSAYSPELSLDFSPIDHLWDNIGRRLSQGHSTITATEMLVAAMLFMTCVVARGYGLRRFFLLVNASLPHAIIPHSSYIMYRQKSNLWCILPYWVRNSLIKLVKSMVFLKFLQF